MKLKFTVIFMIMIVVLEGTCCTFAATKTELNNQSRELDTKIDETKKEIEHVENDLSDAMKEV